MLKSGVFHLFETLNKKKVDQLYREAVEECVLAEELGFEGIHPAEHHFSKHYGIMPRTEIFLAYVAARTSRIKLAPQCIVSPLAEPLRLAEDCAMLDILSGGRFSFSCGAGYRKYEFDKLNFDIEENRERLREICDIVQKAWTGEKFSHQGKYYQYEDVQVVPTPLQQPHPDIWVTTANPSTIEWTIKHRHTVMATAGFSLKAFQKVLGIIHDSGIKPESSTVPFFKWLYVAETDEEARAVGQPAFVKTIAAFMQSGERLVEGLLKSIQMAEGEDKMARLSGEDIGAFICGSPETIIKELKPFVEAGGNYFIGGFNIGAIPTEQVRRSMELYAKDVMPNL